MMLLQRAGFLAGDTQGLWTRLFRTRPCANLVAPPSRAAGLLLADRPYDAARILRDCSETLSFTDARMSVTLPASAAAPLPDAAAGGRSALTAWVPAHLAVMRQRRGQRASVAAFMKDADMVGQGGRCGVVVFGAGLGRGIWRCMGRGKVRKVRGRWAERCELGVWCYDTGPWSPALRRCPGLAWRLVASFTTRCLLCGTLPVLCIRRPFAPTYRWQACT